MRKMLITAILAIVGSMTARGGVDIHVNIGAPPYYGYAPREVVYVERFVPAYEVPRVLVVSRYAGVAPVVVVNLYRRGWGWDRICGYYGVPRQAVYGPPYGNAFGHYKKHGHHGRH